MNKEKEVLTTDAGIPVSDNQNLLGAGARGPLLMQDFYLNEKVAHSHQEFIPQRVVNAKSSGAYGTVTTTNYTQVGNLLRFLPVLPQLCKVYRT
ncbi:catalase [Nostoc sp. CENA67]|uniref:Catalase n=1 Tax=Amazonocrinis nigriterrae CENA67 TaxID=2794033 RepID=A0A8J7LAF6_9NOST|nr:catalase [Amazonocrinis nigriterrae]MBH8562551.1 catalase [Amazonocrinis nigriterrae CENA67]